MKHFFKFLLFTLCIVTLHVSGTDAKKVDSTSSIPNKNLLKKQGCNEKRQLQLEQDMQKLFSIGSKNARNIPENFKDAQEYCREINSVFRQTESFFKRCYKKSVQNFVKIFFYTAKKNLQKHCGKKESKMVKILLSVAPCANAHLKGNSRAQHCHRVFLNQTKQLINIADDRLKMSHSCCYFVEQTKCFENFMNTIPCMRPHVNTIMDLISSETGSLTNMMCGEYNESTDACEKLGAPPAPIKPNNKNYLTPVSLFIDLLASMDASNLPTNA